MGKALAAADVVVVTDVYAAREAPLPGVTGELVANAARTAGAEVIWVQARADVAPEVADLVRSGDVVVTMGAGDITWAGREILGLREKGATV
jgi:UDP-N-acetylmuramate--alanine ligase